MANKGTMHPLHPANLTRILAGSTLLAWLVTVIADVMWLPLPILPLSASYTLIALLVLLAGLAVPLYMKYTGARVAPLNPIVSTRTIVLTQATMITAVLLGGWHLGALFFLLPSWASRPVHTPYFSCLAVIALCTLLLILSWFIQKWSIVKEDEE
ncbi:MAG: DUF3180 family protein [Micrococcaceae bacterium]